MKKVLTVALVLLLCLMVALPVAGANVTEVPSPDPKEPEIKQANLNGLALDECIIITTLEQAEAKTTDITQEERDTLIAAYKGLEDGTLSLPLSGEYVVRDIVDISFKYAECRQIEEHGHKDDVLKEEGVLLTVDFDMGVGEDERVCVMTYIDGKWEVIKSAENNGDGTVTCVFEDLCPVAFAVVG